MDKKKRPNFAGLKVWRSDMTGKPKPRPPKLRPDQTMAEWEKTRKADRKKLLANLKL
jgi:hypothetical protein